jgi:hypothetical protein
MNGSRIAFESKRAVETTGQLGGAENLSRRLTVEEQQVKDLQSEFEGAGQYRKLLIVRSISRSN